MDGTTGRLSQSCKHVDSESSRFNNYSIKPFLYLQIFQLRKLIIMSTPEFINSTSGAIILYMKACPYVDFSTKVTYYPYSTSLRDKFSRKLSKDSLNYSNAHLVQVEKNKKRGGVS